MIRFMNMSIVFNCAWCNIAESFVWAKPMVDPGPAKPMEVAASGDLSGFESLPSTPQFRQAVIGLPHLNIVKYN